MKHENETKDLVIDTITKSHYIDKSAEHLIILQTPDGDKSLDELVIKYIPDGYYHIPTMIGKTQRYYEKILLETGSIKVQHNYRGAKSKEEYAFSKISIEKVLSFDDWIQNKNPNHFQRFFDTNFPSPKYYNFWDYQKHGKKSF